MWLHKDNTSANYSSFKANYQQPERKAIVDLLVQISKRLKQ